MIISMDVELIHKLGYDNLLSNVLSHWKKLITSHLLKLDKDKHDEVKNEFLGVVREAIKDDKVVVINNQFFYSHSLKKKPLWSRWMKNLKQKNGFHYLKQM